MWKGQDNGSGAQLSACSHNIVWDMHSPSEGHSATSILSPFFPTPSPPLTASTPPHLSRYHPPRPPPPPHGVSTATVPPNSGCRSMSPRYNEAARQASSQLDTDPPPPPPLPLPPPRFSRPTAQSSTARGASRGLVLRGTYGKLLRCEKGETVRTIGQSAMANGVNG